MTDQLLSCRSFSNMPPKGARADKLRAHTQDGKLCDFNWRESGILHEITLVEDGAVLQIGNKFYHIRDKVPPKHPPIIYKDTQGQHYKGVEVNASLGGAVNTEESDAVVLSGVGKIRLGKEIVHVSSDDTLTINGVKYKAGDKVCIDGREANISLAAKMQ